MEHFEKVVYIDKFELICIVLVLIYYHEKKILVVLMRFFQCINLKLMRTLKHRINH